MRIKILSFILIWLTIKIFFPESACSQVVKIDSVSVDSLRTSLKDDLFLDVNGEICSMIVLLTDLENLKFYANLGIEKIIRYDDGYKIYLPSQASILKILIPDFPLFEYELPRQNYRHAVYLMVLKTELPQKIVLQDTLSTSISFYTTPAKAKIILNNERIGKAPVILKDPPFSTFTYSVKKKGYETFTATDSIENKNESIEVDLLDLHRSKRVFLTFYYGLGGGIWNSYRVDASGRSTGFTLGMFGKTGFYGSLYLRSTEVSPVMDPDEYHKYVKSREINLIGGVTQQLGRAVFIYGGPGFSSRVYQQWAQITEDKTRSIDLNTGIIFRIGWYSILQINFSRSITEPYVSLGLGLGYNFPYRRNK